jgi:hypothetical protein
MSKGQSQKATTSEDQILPLTRVLAAIVVPALVIASIILYLMPQRSGELFAWAVQPTMTAMMLGATYAGGIYFFSRVLLGRSWNAVRLGFLPVTSFATLLGLATILHWENFTQGHLAFQLWALLYFVLPFLLPIAWYLNRRATSPPPGGKKATMLPRGVRRMFSGLGYFFTAVALALFLFPSLMIPTWPWTLSPLTARVMAAMFILPGLVGIAIGRDGRWSSARYILHAQILSIVLILLAVLITPGDVEWDRFFAQLFVAGLSFILVIVASVAWRFERRSPGAS